MKQILTLYDAEREEARYCLEDQRRLVRKSAWKELKTLEYWKSYICHYIVMAQWLKTKGVITDNDYNTYFWLGIPEPFQTKLETYTFS